jgi:hypothetical protein
VHPAGAKRSAGWLVLWCIAAACSHESPGEPGSYTPNAPRGGGPPLQLTYNLGVDQSPVWLPDGSGFYYTTERLDRRDKDRCLALLPAGGGTIEREICDRAPAADDSVNALTSLALNPDGRIAYLQASAPLAFGWPVAPRSAQIVVATLDHPTASQVVRPVPYTAPSGRQQQAVAQMRWLDDSSLVYVGEEVQYASACIGCPLDTLASGLELDVLDLRTQPPTIRMLDSTDQASSVAVAGRNTVYFTINGDARVFRLDVGSGSWSVVHDFGASGIARDVQVSGSRLVAVVGGNVTFVDDPALGLVQRDSGGQLVLVDLTTGGETPLTDPSRFFRHPALSSDGRTVIAEMRLGRTSDLWLVAVP